MVICDVIKFLVDMGVFVGVMVFDFDIVKCYFVFGVLFVVVVVDLVLLVKVVCDICVFF